MPDRKPLISGNWKMNLNHFEATATLDKLRYLLTKDDYEEVDVSVHPPFTDIRTVQTFIESEKVQIALGAQNCHWEEKGAFTGEVAPAMLAKLNVAYVIVGHSERREIFGETDDGSHRKVNAVVKHGMTPILCCGETLEEREGAAHHGKVTGQIHAGLAGSPPSRSAGWSSPTSRSGRSAPARRPAPTTPRRSCAWIREKVAEMKGADAAAAVRIQYGGSVKAANAAELMAQPDIDGALVGGAALDADEFARIVQYRLA